MTFRLDQETAERIDRLAQRLEIPKSWVVIEAERSRMLAVFDELVPQIPERPAADVEQELAGLRVERPG